jgi:hypothetical protein
MLVTGGASEVFEALEDTEREGNLVFFLLDF